MIGPLLFKGIDVGQPLLLPDDVRSPQRGTEVNYLSNRQPKNQFGHNSFQHGLLCFIIFTLTIQILMFLGAGFQPSIETVKILALINIKLTVRGLLAVNGRDRYHIFGDHFRDRPIYVQTILLIKSQPSHCLTLHHDRQD